MSRRFARLYTDGSLNVDAGDVDFETAKKRLGLSTDDDDTELVEITFEVIKSFGRPKLSVVPKDRITCSSHPVDVLKQFIDMDPEWERQARAICDEVVIVSRKAGEPA